MRVLGFLLLFLANVTYSHTSYKQKISCPIDGTKFDIYVTGSYTTTGTYYDFQKKGYIGDLYESSVVSCPDCHYSGYRNDFDTTFSKETKDSILQILLPYKKEKLDDVMENEIAIALYLFWNKPNNQIAYLYLVASYFLRFEEDKQEKRKEMQLSCINYILKAIEFKEYEDKETYASQYYLVGEMYRRVGDFDNALAYYKIASEQNHKPKWLDEILKEQIKLAENKDDINTI